MKKKLGTQIANVVLSLLFFTLLLCFSKNMAYAKDHLSKGDIFYDSDYKYKVVEESKPLYSDKYNNTYSYGKVQMLGFNPDRTNQSLVKIYSDVRCAETDERFFIASVAKNAFKNCSSIEGIEIYLNYTNNGVYNYYHSTLRLMSGSFKNCNHLEYFNMQLGTGDDYKLIIDKNAFKGCSKFSYIGSGDLDNLNGGEAGTSVKSKIVINKKAFPSTKKITVCHHINICNMVNMEGYHNQHKALAKMIKKSGVKTVKYWYAYKMRKV
ncbi:hypothetical protein [Butyrivibrio sp. AE3004]|uniref:hypothetical protein n=1 Tax=Butyrivibrio sp. AE3004 TaxID=1506994 RepID=UPI0004942784|nr:hypothetical protein [Butyrivibrio sp. AE3004]